MENALLSVVDVVPYNSVGNQSFRTLLSAKCGSSRFLLPTDVHFNPLQHNIATLLESFAAVEGHPSRRQHHN